MSDPLNDLLKVIEDLDKKRARLEAQEKKVFGAPLRDVVLIFPAERDEDGLILLKEDPELWALWREARKMNVECRLSEHVDRIYSMKKSKHLTSIFDGDPPEQKLYRK